jgi:hypothetical protein
LHGSTDHVTRALEGISSRCMCDPSRCTGRTIGQLWVSNGQGTCYRAEIGHLADRSAAIPARHRPSWWWSAQNWAICSERHLIARGLIDYHSIVFEFSNEILLEKKEAPLPPSPSPCSFLSLAEGRDKRWMDARLRALHSAQCKWTHPEIFVFPAPFLPVRLAATFIGNNLGIRNGTRVYSDSGPDVQLPVHLCVFSCSCVTGCGAISAQRRRRIRGRPFPLFAVMLSSGAKDGVIIRLPASLFGSKYFCWPLDLGTISG